MKRGIRIIIGLLLVFCLGFVIRGSMRAVLIQEIRDLQMSLVPDTTSTSDYDARLYELAYSSPVAPEKVGLWIEAVLVRKFETFSANQKPVSPKLAKKLRGWPLNITTEIDLSDSGATDDVIAILGKLPDTDWVNLTGTQVTEKALLSLLKRAPNLARLELADTRISWNSHLVDTLVSQGTIKELFLDETLLNPEDLNRLRSAMRSR